MHEQENKEEEILPNKPTKSQLESLYENWFLDYASYVILERAVPSLEDGLKPVQRRILHSMNEMDDGRFHKVAGIIGNTMQYHPHGDAAIGDALVNLGQKDLLIETQGNWGDIRTGDSAAAPRYIEARLTSFAKEVLFHDGITDWQRSYDGRKKEPILLPVKFPLLLVQGVEGIAVGLATKVMPHNFNELLDASCQILKGEEFEIFPDFPSGGTADFSNYNNGQKGGRIRIRAHIEVLDRKTLVIKDIPYATTTTSVIDSIIKANDNGKIKVKKVTDNTAKDIEIIIELPTGIDPEMTVDALYAFTDCEISISPNCCVIVNEKPQFLGVDELLIKSTQNTVNILQKELQVALQQLQEKWHFSLLEKIFIEKRIYRKIEDCETWEDVIRCIQTELHPYRHQFLREINEDDIVKLTEIKIKRISKYNNNKAEELLKQLEKEIATTKYHLENLTEYTIRYFQSLKEKYGKNYLRKTKMESFDNIVAAKVAVANQKLYINRKDGFVGFSLKKDEFICDCSDIDDIIVFLRTGQCKVVKIADKTFVGKDILYADVWKKGDERKIYNLAYRDGTDGTTYAKRFAVTAITRDKEYDLTKGNKGSKILYFTANPNGETETVTVHLNAKAQARNKNIDFDFATLAIKGRSSQGNIITKHPIARIVQKDLGSSSFGPMDIWYQEETGQINNEQRGIPLGSFDTKDLILVITKDGNCDLATYQLDYQYKPKSIKIIEKHDPEKIITAIHYDGNKQHIFVKRFQLDANMAGKKCVITTDHPDSKLLHIFSGLDAYIKLVVIKRNQEVEEIIHLDSFMDIKGWKANGNRLSNFEIVKITPLTPKEIQEHKGEIPQNESESDSENKQDVTSEQKNEQKTPEVAHPETNYTKSNKNENEQMALW